MLSKDLQSSLTFAQVRFATFRSGSLKFVEVRQFLQASSSPMICTFVKYRQGSIMFATLRFAEAREGFLEFAKVLEVSPRFFKFLSRSSNVL